MSRILPFALVLLAPLVAAQDGVTVYTTDPTIVGAEIRDWQGEGTALRLHDETGVLYGRLEPLISGTGGFFELDAPNGVAGFTVDQGTGASGVLFRTGPSSGNPAVFDSGQTGSASVVLPTDAVQASEILDEPGVANNNNRNGIGLDSGFNVTLTRTLTAPASGFVLALATAELGITHTNGSRSALQLAVSESCNATSPGAPPLTQQQNLLIPSTAASGTYALMNSVHGLFAVSEGVNTFCIVIQEIDTTNGSVDDQNLTLVYLPTSYGVVVSNITAPDSGVGPEEALDTPGRPLTAAEVEAEREASVRAYEARVAAEVRALRARLDAIEREMEAGRNRQSGVRE